MARIMFAALVGAVMVASPALAAQSVRPEIAAIKSKPINLQSGARVGAATRKKHSELAPAAAGTALALAVAVGGGAALVASSGGSSSP